MKIFARLKNIWFCAAIVPLLFQSGCVKENFVEPVDPFVMQELSPDAKTITLGKGPNAITLKTNPENITETSSGMRVQGTLYAVNDKYGDMSITTGDFQFSRDTTLAKGSSDPNNYLGMEGFSLMDIPHVGFLKDLNIMGLNAFNYGYQKGSEFQLGSFEWPLNPDRYYLFFQNENSIVQAAMSGSGAKFNLQKLAYDPSDPLVLFLCEFSIPGGPFPDLEFEDVGLGISVQGKLHYDPICTIGGITGFDANLFLSGSIPITYKDIGGVKISGEGFVGFNPGDDDGIVKFFKGEENNFKLGLNGRMTLESSVLSFLNLDLTLADGSIVLAVTDKGDVEFKFAGERQLPPMEPREIMQQMIGVDWKFLDNLEFPLQIKQIIYGTVGTDISDWMFGFKSTTTLKLPLFDPIDMGEAAVELCPDHLYFKGQMYLGFFNAKAGIEGLVQKTGQFKFTGYIESEGSVDLKIISLSYYIGCNLSLEYDGDDFFIRGEFKLEGEACLGKLCASITIKASAEIGTDGSFEVCFSIGVSGSGAEVCFSKEADSTAPHGYREVMTAREIPIEQVPLENRFIGIEK